jgi:hypothetical protein
VIHEAEDVPAFSILGWVDTQTLLRSRDRALLGMWFCLRQTDTSGPSCTALVSRIHEKLQQRMEASEVLGVSFKR